MFADKTDFYKKRLLMCQLVGSLSLTLLCSSPLAAGAKGSTVSDGGKEVNVKGAAAKDLKVKPLSKPVVKAKAAVTQASQQGGSRAPVVPTDANSAVGKGSRASGVAASKQKATIPKSVEQVNSRVGTSSQASGLLEPVGQTTSKSVDAKGGGASSQSTTGSKQTATPRSASKASANSREGSSIQALVPAAVKSVDGRGTKYGAASLNQKVLEPKSGNREPAISRDAGSAAVRPLATSSSKSAVSAGAKTPVLNQAASASKSATVGTKQKTAKPDQSSVYSAIAAASGSKVPSAGSASAKKAAGSNSAAVGTNGDKDKSAKSSSRRRSSAKSSPGMLVPPPPPTIPTYLTPPAGFGVQTEEGMSVQYMSMEDLQLQSKNLSKKLESARLDLTDATRFLQEQKDRAERFVSLYDEGVVSRKELELAKEEVERETRKKELAALKVDELDRVQKDVNERIKTLEKSKASQQKKTSKKRK